MTQRGWRVFADVQLSEAEVHAIEVETGDTYEDRDLVSSDQFHFLAADFTEARLLAELYLENNFEVYTVTGIVMFQNPDGSNVEFLTGKDLLGEDDECHCPLCRYDDAEDKDRMIFNCTNGKCGKAIYIVREGWQVIQCPHCNEVIWREDVGMKGISDDATKMLE
jgi:hypothetical protein